MGPTGIRSLPFSSPSSACIWVQLIQYPSVFQVANQMANRMNLAVDTEMPDLGEDPGALGSTVEQSIRVPGLETPGLASTAEASYRAPRLLLQVRAPEQFFHASHDLLQHSAPCIDIRL